MCPRPVLLIPKVVKPTACLDQAVAVLTCRSFVHFPCLVLEEPTQFFCAAMARPWLVGTMVMGNAIFLFWKGTLATRRLRERADEEMEDDGSGAHPAVDEEVKEEDMESHATSAAMRAQWQVKQWNEVWWDIPPQISQFIEVAREKGCCNATFVYDWGYQRKVNYVDPKTNQRATLSRCQIDFDTNMQRNLDTGNCREVRVVYLDMRFTPKQVQE